MKKLFSKEVLQHAVESWKAGSHEPIECTNNIDYSTLREIKKEMRKKVIFTIR